MRVEYNPHVSRDAEEIFRHYEKVSTALAHGFMHDLGLVIAKAAENPLRFHVARHFRRANPRRFPYHVLYRILVDGIRVVVVRHNKRHPRYGITRA